MINCEIIILLFSCFYYFFKGQQVTKLALKNWDMGKKKEKEMRDDGR